MNKYFLCFLIFFQLTRFCEAQPANTNISNGLFFEGEPYLVVNPNNSQNIVVAWMGFKLSAGYYRIAIKTCASFNGGLTWSAINSLPHVSPGYGSADVSMAFTTNGLLYISYIDFRQAPDSGGIFVARSVDGGLNWDTPSKAFDMYDDPTKRPIDRPWLVVDNSTSSTSGTLYITSKPAPWIAPPNRNYFKVSSDSGHSWSALANVDGGNYLIGNLIPAPMAAPAVTKDGYFCAIYPSYVASQNIYPAYYCARSNNQGQSFSYSTVYAALPGAIDTNYKNGYQLIAHPSDSSKLIFLTPDAQSGDGDIKAFSSSDAGLTWTSPVRVNDDALANGKAQDMVWGAYNQQGNLLVTWRDRRNSSVSGFWNAGYDFYYTTSSNNGLTFAPNKKLSSQFIAFDSIISASGNDFMSCAYSGDTIYSVWGDTRNTKMNIYFAKTIASTNTNVAFSLIGSSTSKFKIYPNPSIAYIDIVSNENLVGKEICVYDVNGTKIYCNLVKSNKTRIDTKAFKSGAYFIKVDDEIKRFIKE